MSSRAIESVSRLNYSREEQRKKAKSTPKKFTLSPLRQTQAKHGITLRSPSILEANLTEVQNTKVEKLSFKRKEQSRDLSAV